MAQVSSVNLDQSVQVGGRFEKGDALGGFLFGGSDFIMLFQPRAGFKLTAPRVQATGEQTHAGEAVYEHLLMGEPYGVMRGARRAEP